MDIVVTVKEIRGRCPTFNKTGESFVLKAGYQLVSDIPICMHALAALMPFYNALYLCDPEKLGLDGVEDKSKAYIQCPDPYQCTNGGTVIFEISKRP